MAEITHRTTVQRATRVAARIIDGTAVVVIIDRQELHTLNAVGTRVWELADGRTVAEIADAIVAEYEVEPPLALSDVVRFTEKLSDLGALELGSQQ